MKLVSVPVILEINFKSLLFKNNLNACSILGVIYIGKKCNSNGALSLDLQSQVHVIAVRLYAGVCAWPSLLLKWNKGHPHPQTATGQRQDPRSRHRNHSRASRQ
jgi:hypothetical protein